MRRFVNPGKRIASFTRTFARMRWALMFDGVGVRGQLANRAINPDGDIDIEWEQLDYDTTSFGASSIVTQCLTATFASRELMLRIEANESIALYFGGNVVTTPVNFYGTGKWRVTLIGSSWVVYKNGLVVYSTSFTRGAAREPSAQTVIGARNNGGTFVDYKKGTLYNVKINGTRWPMADRNQAIQLPEPSGLGAELFANPSLSSGASGWGRINADAANEGQFLRLTNTTAAAGFIFQTVNTVAGVKYVVRVNSIVTTGTALRITINNGSSAAYTGSIFNKNVISSEIGQQLFVEFEATGVQTTIGFFVNGASIGNSIVISNAEVKPLGTCNPMTISNATSANWMQVVDDYVRKFRKVLRFDGIGARGTFTNRAINPDGDIDIEWEQKTTLKADGNVFVSQCGYGANSTQEFRLTERSDGVLELIVGGVVKAVATSAQGYERVGRYKLSLIGTNLQLLKNGAVLVSESFVRGAIREPSALTQVGVRGESTKVNYLLGVLYNLKINGTLWPIAESTQSIQLPEPSGLGAELITQSVLENPAVKGSQWAYLGDGRWQYVGDGSYNGLVFITSPLQPDSGYLQFEVESITGLMTAALSNSEANFSSVGVKRYFYKEKGVSNANCIDFKRGSGVASCIIKNISFKPLGTCNPLTLVNVTSTNWEDLEI